MKQQHGFSLLELSIVLVIIGLIAGGIVAGASMIRAAELRAVVTEYQQYQTAVNTFREKYLGLPGDLKNATAFWGTADAGDGIGADCTYTSTTDTTCNGNGDGLIRLTETYAESHLFWEHLSNAELVSGSFTGSPDCASMVLADPFERCQTLGTNAPTSKLNSVGFFSSHLVAQTTASIWAYEGNYGNLFYIGAMQVESGTNDITETPFMSSAEAWSIDKKLDDGRPATGRVRTPKSRPDCVTSTSTTTAEYQLDSNVGDACSLVMIYMPN